jgi:hypothetical protein
MSARHIKSSAEFREIRVVSFDRRHEASIPRGIPARSALTRAGRWVLEWQNVGGGKQPYLIEMIDGSPFALAGRWERWKNPDLHDPHHLAREERPRWLGEGEATADQLPQMSAPKANRPSIVSY